LASVSLLPLVLNEFNVVVSDVVAQELREMSTYADLYGTAANEVLMNIDRIQVKKTLNYQRFKTSRIDAGEASCMEIIESREQDYLLTDDFRALGEIEKLIGDRVVLSPIILKVLVIRGRIDKHQALTKLDEMAEKRDWLGRPIYKYAKSYFVGL
jgi:predicted nucleic acid-binding protein